MVFRRHIGEFVFLLLILLLTAAREADAAEFRLYDRPITVVDPGMHTGPIKQSDTDAAGRIAVTGSEDKTVRVWSVADGELLRTIRMPTGPGNIGKVYAVALDPDGNTIAVGGWTRGLGKEQIYLFDATTGAMSTRLGGLPIVVNHLTFSPQGTRLAAVLGDGGGLRLYEKTEAGGWTELARDTEYRMVASYGVAFAPDGRLATTSEDGRLRLYDPEGRLLRSVKTKIAFPVGLAFNPIDGRLAVGFAVRPEVQIYNGRTLAELPTPKIAGTGNGNLRSVAWSADGKVLFAGGTYSEIRDSVGPVPVNEYGPKVIVWETDRRATSPALTPGLKAISGMRPLPDGGLLVASEDPWLGRVGRNKALLWSRGSMQADLRDQYVRVSSDGQVVDFRLDAWGEELLRFDANALKLSPNLSDDGSTTAPIDGGIHIKSPNIRSFHAEGDVPLPVCPQVASRRLAIHPDDGRFLLGTGWSLRACDAEGKQLWLNEVPGAVRAVNIAAEGRLAIAGYGDGTIRWHRMEDGVELLAFYPFRDGKNWIAWEPDGRFASTQGARRALKWFINRGWDQEPMELRAGQIPKSYRPEVIRRVLPQMGTMQAVYAAEEAERTEAFRRLTGGLAPGARLHVLAVGVGDYGNAIERLRLEWADEDAADIAAALAGQMDWPYQPGFQMVLSQTEAKGLIILDQLGKIRERMRLAPDGRDLAIFMFSGHGVVRGEGVTEEFFLLPHDADVATETRIRRTGIAGNELQSQLAGIATYGRVLVLLDTCSSGAALGEGELGVKDSLLRRRLAWDNVTVLASSAGSEISREDAEWRNGAFTEVVLEALGRAGDSDGNGMISVEELTAYVSRRLPVLSGDSQTPSIQTRFHGDLFLSGL